MTKSKEQHPHFKSGEYDAIWGGWEVEIIFPNGQKSYSIDVNEGIRTIEFKCRVKIDEDGWIYIIH